MKYISYRNCLVLGTIILLFGANFAVGNVPNTGEKIENEEHYKEINNNYKHLISVEQAQEMIRTQSAVILDVQDKYNYSYINGVIPVLLSDLDCGSCTEKKFKDQENIIVYSESIKLRKKASNILKGLGYTIYELVDEIALDDFPLSYQTSSPNKENEITKSLNEEHSPIQISGSAARVNAYKRNGQIKRLYGEAFSKGESPEESVETFIQANANVFGIDPTDLDDRYIQPIMYNHDTGDYKFYSINYAQYKDGIHVFRSRLILLVRNEEGYPLVLASVDLRDLSGFTPEIESSKLNPGAGINNALTRSPSLVYFTQPELVVWAGIDDMIVKPTLAYSFIGDNRYQSGSNSPEKYFFITDAETGDILYTENFIIFTNVTGNVQGKTTQGKGPDICENEEAEPLKYARVNIDSTVAYTDENGNFTIPNSGSSQVTVESRLWGKWFRVYNQAGGDTVLYKTVTPPGPANFMHNNLNNNEYIRAEVNGYYQANIVRDFTLVYNPDYPGLSETEFPVNVNIDSNCNAYYDYESINFFRAGGGCPNTGYSTIVHHEYGHHLVAMAGSGQGQYGEGMGDVMGTLITDDSGIGYGFHSDCDDPLRNANNTLQYPCSGEIHYCGQLISGCVWDTRNELKKTNPTNYSDIISNLAINAMLLHTGSMITPSITIDYLVLDDDNGIIYDGTPHYYEIAAGFGSHNMDAPPLALLIFEFPDGLPDLIAPFGGTTVRVIVNNGSANPKSDTGVLHFNDGSGWDDTPMTQIETNIYDAIFPDGACQSQILFYFSVETTDGETQFWPMGAPDEVYTTVFAFGSEILISDDFETDLGWTVENDCSDGEWERGIPVSWNRGDPPSDYDSSGQCYLTDNDPYDDNCDVDDGYTWLISPTIDLSFYDNAKVDYALWYTNNFGDDPNNDHFIVYVSNDDGGNWNLVETIGPVTSSGWKEKSFLIGDFVIPTSQTKIRFEASDINGGSVVEAGIDAFSVTVYNCTHQGPDTPTINGQKNGKTGKEYEYTFSTIDPNEEDVYYYIEWGDGGIEEWIGPHASGEEVKVSHIWSEKGTYIIKGRAKDVDGNIGFWGELEISMPKSKPYNINPMFQSFLENNPNLFPIIRQILGL